MKKLALVLIALTATAGCAVEQKSFESEPVVVATRGGNVTCQLYSARMVIWDEAIDLPDGMRIVEADRICQYAGQRQKEGKDPRVTHPAWAPVSQASAN